MDPDTVLRAKLALAAAAQHAADLCRGVLGNVSSPMVPGERIRAARRARLESLRVTDLAVLAELGEGTSWETVAAALALEVAETRRIYEPLVAAWCDRENSSAVVGDFGVGGLSDEDPIGTAIFLDSWWERHTEPWDTLDGSQPVGRLFGADGTL